MTDAVEGTAEAADAATETATEEASTGIADLMAMSGELLSLEGFDADKVTQLIEGSGMSDAQKATLTRAVDVAKDNPALLQPVLERIQSLIGN